MARLSEAHNARNVLILTGVGHFSAHAFELLFPTLAVTLAGQTHMPLDLVLGWSFLGYLLFGLGALPAALVAERLSPRLLLITALFGVGVAALAASEAPNGRVLSLSLAAMGGCASMLHPAAARLTSHAIAAVDRARRVHALCSAAAIALTPLIIAALCARLGWQPTFRAVGYAVCAVAVAGAFLRVAEQRSAPAHVPDAAPPRRDALLPLVVLLAAACLAGIGYRGGTLVLPGYFAGRVSELGFGAATSLAYAVGVVGQFVGRRLADRYDPRRLYLVVSAVGVPALLLMTVLSGLPLVGVAALYAFCSLGLRPIEATLFTQYLPPRQRGVASAAVTALTLGVGALAVWLVGWSGAAGGLSFALLCLAAVLALVVAAAALLAYLGERGPAHGFPGGRRAVGAGGGVVFDAAPAAAPAERRPPERIRIP